MSAMMKTVATVFYWASGSAGGKGLGHMAVKLANGAYVSHFPDKTSTAITLSRRNDIPGLKGVNVVVQRFGSDRHRTLEADLEHFGSCTGTMELPAFFINILMQEFAKGRMLATGDAEGIVEGPMPYYQLADSTVGKKDRSQCTTTTAMLLSTGVPGTHKRYLRAIQNQFQPDALWKALNEIKKNAEKSLEE
ncbi:hypothetical protein ACG04Q_03125 [Roseateles sp. DXS20W]|uniref:Uncharacterized protein n=1 Tax=Pelomonas lactea TaxID=3299030 RepID=A0ABW7GF34_9BURK